VQKWLVGDVPLKENFLLKVNHPLARERMPAMQTFIKWSAILHGKRLCCVLSPPLAA